MGAGVASLLAILLQPRLRNVHAFAFAPTCTLPLHLCRKHERLIDGYVYANDVIPRVSLGSLLQLRQAIELAACGEDRALRRHLQRCRQQPHPDCRFPPGRVRLLRPRPRRGSRRESTATIVALPRKSLGVIPVHHSMLRDHGFDRYEESIRAVAG